MSDIGRCATCKFWREPNSQYDVGVGMGLRKCWTVPMFWNATDWDEDGSRTFDAKYANTTAFVQDGSDYKADLYTKAEHGCTMHQPTEPRQ